MALLASEIARIRTELGYNVIGVQAEPYIGFVGVFDTVIQQYITSGASTTSTTPVLEADDPTPQSITVLSAVGFQAGQLMIVDVDTRQERATITSVNGLAITAQLTLAHGPGVYPVTVEGGESIVRQILNELLKLGAGGLNGRAGRMSKIAGRLGIKKVDEVEFFGGKADGYDVLSQMIKMQEYWRDELAATLGVERLNRRGGGGCTVLG